MSGLNGIGNSMRRGAVTPDLLRALRHPSSWAQPRCFHLQRAQRAARGQIQRTKIWPAEGQVPQYFDKSMFEEAFARK